MLIRVDPEKPDVGLIGAAANMARIGQLIVFQTDTIYGVGTSAQSEAGVERLFSRKNRSTDKPLGVFLSSINEAQNYCIINDKHIKFLENIWPGPVTCVFKRRKSTSLWVTPKAEQPPTIAVRIPKSNVVHHLLDELNVPLLQTSVNVSGQRHLSHKELVSEYRRFGDVMIDSGPEKSLQPSTVISLIGDEVKLIREGSTPWNSISMSLEMSGAI